MYFSLQNKPKNILSNPFVVVILLLLLVIVCGALYISQGIGAVYAILFIVACVAIAVSIKSLGKKGFPEFDTSDQGVSVDGKLYPWSDMEYYSWYGEKQSERVGAVGVGGVLAYDPINVSAFSKAPILELHLGIGRNLKLQIDAAQAQNLTSILSQYGVKHISMLRKIVGF